MSDLIPDSALDEAPSDSSPSGDVIPSAAFSPFQPAAAAPTPQAAAPVAPTWWNAIKGVGETGLALGSGTLKSMTGAVNDLMPGKEGRGALAKEIENDPILNYRGGPESQPIMDALGTVAKPLSAAGKFLHGKIADVAGERTADVAGDIATLAPFAKNLWPGKGAAAAGEIEQGHPLTAASEAEVSRLNDIRARAKTSGFELPEGGTAAQHAAAAETNQPLANAAIRSELRLPKNAPLTPEILDSARKAYASPAYEAIKELPAPIKLGPEQEAVLKDAAGLIPEKLGVPTEGTITGQQAVELTKKLRTRANQLDRAQGITASGDLPSDLAQAHRDAAEAIEDAVEQHLQGSGQGQLAKAWNDARIYTAKTYSVQNALDGAGNVRVTQLKSQLLKGKPLSGALSDLAHLGSQYPEAFRLTRESAPAPGLIRKGVAAALPWATTAAGATLVPGPYGAVGGKMLGEHLAGKINPP